MEFTLIETVNLDGIKDDIKIEDNSYEYYERQLPKKKIKR